MNDITRLKDTFDQMGVEYRQFSGERDSHHYIVIHIDGGDSGVAPVRFVFDNSGNLVKVEGD